MNIRFSLITILTVALVVSCQNSTKIQLPPKGLCAHRGAMGAYPENTIVAFDAAIKAGAQMIELDVRITKDNKMVIMHDATVDRTTNGAGRVTNLTLAEIKKLDAGSWKSDKFKGEKVPTLKESLQIFPRNIWINIHVKGKINTPARIAHLLQKQNRLHQAFLACSANGARIARKEVPDVLICNMDRQESNWDYVDSTIKMRADFIQLKGKVTPDYAQLIKKLKESGVRVNYYGTDSPEEIKQLFDYDVDFPLVNNIVNTIKYYNK